MAPENLQVSTFKKRFLASIQKVFFLQRRRWITKTVNKTEQWGIGSFAFVFVPFAKNKKKKRLAIQNQINFAPPVIVEKLEKVV